MTIIGITSNSNNSSSIHNALIHRSLECGNDKHRHFDHCLYKTRHEHIPRSRTLEKNDSSTTVDVVDDINKFPPKPNPTYWKAAVATDDIINFTAQGSRGEAKAAEKFLGLAEFYGAERFSQKTHSMMRKVGASGPSARAISQHSPYPWHQWSLNLSQWYLNNVGCRMPRGNDDTEDTLAETSFLKDGVSTSDDLERTTAAWVTTSGSEWWASEGLSAHQLVQQAGENEKNKLIGSSNFNGLLPDHKKLTVDILNVTGYDGHHGYSGNPNGRNFHVASYLKSLECSGDSYNRSVHANNGHGNSIYLAKVRNTLTSPRVLATRSDTVLEYQSKSTSEKPQFLPDFYRTSCQGVLANRPGSVKSPDIEFLSKSVNVKLDSLEALSVSESQSPDKRSNPDSNVEMRLEMCAFNGDNDLADKANFIESTADKVAPNCENHGEKLYEVSLNDLNPVSYPKHMSSSQVHTNCGTVISPKVFAPKSLEEKDKKDTQLLVESRLKLRNAYEASSAGCQYDEKEYTLGWEDSTKAQVGSLALDPNTMSRSLLAFQPNGREQVLYQVNSIATHDALSSSRNKKCFSVSTKVNISHSLLQEKDSQFHYKTNFDAPTSHHNTDLLKCHHTIINLPIERWPEQKTIEPAIDSRGQLKTLPLDKIYQQNHDSRTMAKDKVSKVVASIPCSKNSGVYARKTSDVCKCRMHTKTEGQSSAKSATTDSAIANIAATTGMKMNIMRGLPPRGNGTSFFDHASSGMRLIKRCTPRANSLYTSVTTMHTSRTNRSPVVRANKKPKNSGGFTRKPVYFEVMKARLTNPKSIPSFKKAQAEMRSVVFDGRNKLKKNVRESLRTEGSDKINLAVSTIERKKMITLFEGSARHEKRPSTSVDLTTASDSKMITEHTAEAASCDSKKPTGSILNEPTRDAEYEKLSIATDSKLTEIFGDKKMLTSAFMQPQITSRIQKFEIPAPKPQTPESAKANTEINKSTAVNNKKRQAAVLDAQVLSANRRPIVNGNRNKNIVKKSTYAKDSLLNDQQRLNMATFQIKRNIRREGKTEVNPKRANVQKFKDLPPNNLKRYIPKFNPSAMAKETPQKVVTATQAEEAKNNIYIKEKKGASSEQHFDVTSSDDIKVIKDSLNKPGVSAHDSEKKSIAQTSSLIYEHKASSTVNDLASPLDGSTLNELRCVHLETVRQLGTSVDVGHPLPPCPMNDLVPEGTVKPMKRNNFISRQHLLKIARRGSSVDKKSINYSDLKEEITDFTALKFEDVPTSSQLSSHQPYSQSDASTSSSGSVEPSVMDSSYNIPSFSEDFIGIAASKRSASVDFNPEVAGIETSDKNVSDQTKPLLQEKTNFLKGSNTKLHQQFHPQSKPLSAYESTAEEYKHQMNVNTGLFSQAQAYVNHPLENKSMPQPKTEMLSHTNGPFNVQHQKLYQVHSQEQQQHPVEFAVRSRTHVQSQLQSPLQFNSRNKQLKRNRLVRTPEVQPPFQHGAQTRILMDTQSDIHNNLQLQTLAQCVAACPESATLAKPLNAPVQHFDHTGEDNGEPVPQFQLKKRPFENISGLVMSGKHVVSSKHVMSRNGKFGSFKQTTPRVITQCFYFSDLNLFQLTVKPINWPPEVADDRKLSMDIKFHNTVPDW